MARLFTFNIWVAILGLSFITGSKWPAKAPQTEEAVATIPLPEEGAKESLAPQNTMTIPAGSFIINMGVTPQTKANGLKPYGLVYELLKDYNVPVIWSIAPGKGRDSIDFWHNGVAYKGGTFIISAEYRTSTVNSRISHWQGQGVVGATTTLPQEVPVYGVIKSAPRWALNPKKTDISGDYLEDAGIPNSAYYERNNNQLGSCDDVFLIPHDDETSQPNLPNWLQNHKGFVWMGCASSPYIETNLGHKFLTTNGIIFDDKGGIGTATYSHNDEPPMQFMGNSAHLECAKSGKNERYNLSPNSTWRTSTRRLISGPAGTVLAYGPAYGNANNGWVMWSAGHEYIYNDEQNTVALIRAMLNFSFMAVLQKYTEATIDGPSIIQSNASTPFSYTLSPSGGSFTTQWSSSCGGTFAPNTSSPTVTFTPPPGVESCIITVQITDGCGRTFFDSKQVTVEQCQLIAWGDINWSCFEEDNGRILIQQTGGTAPFSYVWTRNEGGSGSGNGTIISNLAPGMYNVTLTDAEDCTAEFQKFVIEHEELIITETVQNTSCGSSNGSILIQANGGGGGQPGKTYNWADLPGTDNPKNRFGLAAGNYTVTVTGSSYNQCSASKTISVSDDGAPTLTHTVSNASCPGTATGGITLSVSGGVPGYTYQWSDGPTTANRSGLLAGAYSVTVTDSKNCKVSASINVGQPSALSVTATIANPSCGANNNGAINLTVSGGTPGYTYQWNDGPSTQNRTGLAAGTYTVTVTDANNCTQVLTRTLNGSSGGINISETVTSAFCGNNNGSITVSITGGNAPYTFDWADLPGTSNPQNRSALAPGTYTLTVTGSAGCSGSKAITVAGSPGPSVSSNITNITCQGSGGGAITLNVTGGVPGYSYLWNDGATTANRSGLAAGTYSVTVTDASNCTATASNMVITQPPALNASASVSNPSCPGAVDGAITLSVSGGTPGYTYLWNDGQTTSTRTGLAAGTYTVTVTDANNCTQVLSRTISGGASINVVTSPGPIQCAGGASGSIFVAVNGGTFPYTFDWDDLPGTTNSQNRSNLPAGIYLLTVTDANGCVGTTAATITEPDGLGLTATPGNVPCFGTATGSISLAISGGVPSYNFLWSDGATTQNRTGIAAGTYSVTLTDGNNCTISETNITVNQPASALQLSAVSTNLSCYGANDGVITLNQTGGTGPFLYNWSGNPTGNGSPSISGLAAGTYAVTVTDANNCAAALSATVTEPSQLTLSLSSLNPTCPPGADPPVNSDGAIDLSVTGGAAPLSYAWSSPDGTGLDPLSQDQTGLSAGTYHVTVTDASGCTASASVTLTNLTPSPAQPGEIIKN